MLFSRYANESDTLMQISYVGSHKMLFSRYANESDTLMQISHVGSYEMLFLGKRLMQRITIGPLIT